MRSAMQAGWLLLAAAAVHAQSSATASSASSSSSSSTPSGSTLTDRSTSTSVSGTVSETFTFASSLSVSTITDGSVSLPTGSYQSFTRQITLTSSSRMAGNNSRNGTTTSNTLLLTGSSNGTTPTRTSASAAPSNTQACNGYPQLCQKRYMNFTEVAAHNSPFVRPNNAASNQMYGILAQLNDGVRMIQHEVRYYQKSLYNCHTSCDILNVGPLQDSLATIRQWIAAHPYEVVTILLANNDYRNVSDYVAPIRDSGIMPYLYVPPKIPMLRDDWPTLSNMILSGKRVVLFMDYQANQTEVPYVLDEFSQMWETPFSPTNITFPCDQQRPPNLPRDQIDERPYLANHNLNVKLSFAGTSILIPNFADLAQVNSINGTAGMNSTGALGVMARDCRSRWGVPPAWLLVDFYNYGNFNGSVFEVAANMNGLNYTGRSQCCGQDTGISGASSLRSSSMLVALAFTVTLFLYL